MDTFYGQRSSDESSLLAKYDLSIDQLDYAFIGSCQDISKLEKIILVLRSGEEGVYPHLVKFAEDRLRNLQPLNNLVLVDEATPHLKFLPNSQKEGHLNEIHNWMKAIKHEEKDLMEMPYIRPSTKNIRGKTFESGRDSFDLQGRLTSRLQVDGSKDEREEFK